MSVHNVQPESVKQPIARDTRVNRAPESSAQTKTPGTSASGVIPIEDIIEISKDARDKAEDFQSKLDEMRSETRALREGLKQAAEAGEGAAAAWREKIICMQIAMRIMSGDKVPEEDHRYLRERDFELNSRAIQLRIEKKDPDEYDRLSKDDDSRGDNAASDASDAGPVAPHPQPQPADAQGPPEGSGSML